MPPLRRTGRMLVTALVAVALAGVAACTTSGPRQGGTKGYITGDGVVTTVEPDSRQPAPTLTGQALDGGTVSLADLRGRVVVLNVWASWCPPCRAEADDLTAAARQRPDAAFVGLNVRDDASAARAFVRTHDIDYPSLVSPDGSALLEFFGMLNLSSLPATIVIDAEFRVAAVVLGQVTTSTLVGLVDDVEKSS